MRNPALIVAGLLLAAAVACTNDYSSFRFCEESANGGGADSGGGAAGAPAPGGGGSGGTQAEAGAPSSDAGSGN
jgi:hypothetical protein